MPYGPSSVSSGFVEAWLSGCLSDKITSRSRRTTGLARTPQNVLDTSEKKAQSKGARRARSQMPSQSG